MRRRLPDLVSGLATADLLADVDYAANYDSFGEFDAESFSTSAGQIAHSAVYENPKVLELICAFIQGAPLPENDRSAPG